MIKLSAIITVCITLLLSSGLSAAENTSPEQKQKPGLYLLSATDSSTIQNDELAHVYRDADATLLEQVKDGLEAREIKVTVVQPGEKIAADAGSHFLVIKVENIELGKLRPFGRTAKVKVSYSLQNKDRFDLVKRTDEETSVQKWQNCVKKISEEIVGNVNSDLEKQTNPAKGEEKKDK